MFFFIYIFDKNSYKTREDINQTKYEELKKLHLEEVAISNASLFVSIEVADKSGISL